MTTRRKKKPEPLHLTLPTGWKELTPQQVSRVAYYRSLGLNEPEYLVRLAAELAGLHPRGSAHDGKGEIIYHFYHRDRGNVSITAEQVTQIAHVLQWSTGEPDPMAAPLLDGHTTPDSELYGITLEQFITADSACSAYIRQGMPEALRMMVAALYPRRRFDPEKLSREARRLDYLPTWQHQAIFLWFCGAKKILFERFPFVFSGEPATDAAAAAGDQVLLGLLSSLNESRVVDNEKLKATDIYEVFYELNLKIQNSQKK